MDERHLRYGTISLTLHTHDCTSERTMRRQLHSPLAQATALLVVNVRYC